MHLSESPSEQVRQLVEQSEQADPAVEYWDDLQHEATEVPPVKVLEVPEGHAVQVVAVPPADQVLAAQSAQSFLPAVIIEIVLPG